MEYYALKDECFEVVDGKYINIFSFLKIFFYYYLGKFSYSLCMLGNVIQKELEGNGNSVTLGHFEGLEPTKDGLNMKMKFNNGIIYFINNLHYIYYEGDYCHAFGARTAEVIVTCAAENGFQNYNIYFC